MRLVALTADAAEAAAAWFRGDSAGTNEFGGFYGVHPKWWTLVDDDDTRYGWIAVEGSAQVGFADLEVDRPDATFAFYIRQEWRGRGLGKSLLGLVADAALGAGVERLVGEAAPTNQASLAALRSAGFTHIGVTDEGYIRFERHLG